MNCQRCGASLKPGAGVCHRCGTRNIGNRCTIDSPSEHAGVIDAAAGNDPFSQRATFSATITIAGPLGTRPVILMAGDRLQIGRSIGPLRDLCGDNISGHHADIEVVTEGVTIEDIGIPGIGSTNGTFLNGIRLPTATPTPLTDETTVHLASDPPLIITCRVEAP